MNDEDEYLDGFYDSTSSDVEQPVIQKVIKYPNKTKYIIMFSILFVVSITSVILLVPKKKDNLEYRKVSEVDAKTTNNYSEYVNTINYSISDGSFDKEINKALNDVDVSVDTLFFICIDIDSDGENELVAYTDDGTNKTILQFEVDEDVVFDDSFQVNSKDSLGYAYSYEDDSNYWFTEFEGEYTIIKHPKRVIKSNDFFEGFSIITKIYNGVPIFDNAFEYKSGYELDIPKLESEEISVDKLLENNALTQEAIKEAALKIKNEKLEEAKKKEEEEKQKELEQQESTTPFTLNDMNLHYGKYKEIGTILYGNFIIHTDGTCELGGNPCTWTYSNHDFGLGSLEQSIEVDVDGAKYQFTSRSNDTITNGESWTISHQD